MPRRTVTHPGGRRAVGAAALAALVAAGAIHAGGASGTVPGANGLIAFESNRTGNSEIFSMAADGSGPRNLTNTGATDQAPVWSPDGTRIAFQTNRDGNLEIYVMNADGSGQTNLTRNGASDFAATWSPDGTRIAFVSSRGGHNQIHVMSAAGGPPTLLTPDALNYGDPAWSPDGTRIAAEGYTFRDSTGSDEDVYLIPAGGGGIPLRLTSAPGADNVPAWSPDGTRLAFQSRRDGNAEVYVMGADGAGQTNLTNNPATDGEPNWSPNGGLLLFQSDRDGSDDVFAMGANGSGPVNLTRAAGHDGRPDWAVALTPPPPPPTEPPPLHPIPPGPAPVTVPLVPPRALGPVGAPTISLRRATLSGVRWAGARVRATLVLSGRAGAGGRATLVLAPIGRRGKPIRLSVPIRGGGFTARAPISGRLVPGRYRVTLVSGGASATGTLALPGPPEGFVDDAYPTAVQAGPPVTGFPTATRAIFAHFHFLTRPAPGRAITVTWNGPAGVGTPVPKPNRASVDAIVKSGDRLPSGRWTATLRVGGVVVRRVVVRVG